MNFLKYLKDKLGLILVFFLNLVLLVGVMGLEVSRSNYRIRKSSLVYAFILSALLLALYLGVDYLKRRSLYRLLKKTEESKDPQYLFNIKRKYSYEDELYSRSINSIYSQAEEKIRAYERREKLYRDFNNIWIHQMKTPISVINLLIDNGIKSSGDLMSLREEVARLENGLDLALYNLRLQDFRLDFRIERVDLLQIIRKVINNNKNSFIVNSIYPKVIIEEELIVKTDGKWMEFIINQIVQNSIKYTKVKDSRKREILVSQSSEGQKLVLSFYDNGVGIDSRDLANVFKAFFTGGNGRLYSESTGMGLYLTKEVLDNLGHSISIESEKGLYTRVNIVFPEEKNIYNL